MTDTTDTDLESAPEPEAIETESVPEDSSSEESSEDVNESDAGDDAVESPSDDSTDDVNEQEAAEDVNEQQPVEVPESVDESDAGDDAVESPSDDSTEHVNEQEATEDVDEPAAADTVITEDELLAGEIEQVVEHAALSPYDRPGRWFVVHTQSGYEKKVKQNLEARTASMNMEGRIHEVVIPVRDVPEFKNGKKVITEKKLFPGYLLVRCALDDDAWYVIRNTPGVTGFVNQGGKPSPLRRRDVETFLGVEADRTQEASKRSKPMFEYGMGETVRVKEGPFADFSGEIIEINEDQLKVKVLVNIFGRETPVELEFAQVARL